MPLRRVLIDSTDVEEGAREAIFGFIAATKSIFVVISLEVNEAIIFNRTAGPLASSLLLRAQFV